MPDVQRYLETMRRLVLWYARKRPECCKGTECPWVLLQPLNSVDFSSAGHNSLSQPSGGFLLRKPGLSPAASIVHPLYVVKSVGQSPEKAPEMVTLAQGRHVCETWFVSPVCALMC